MDSIAHVWHSVQAYRHGLPDYFKPILATTIVAIIGYLLRKVPRRVWEFIRNLYDGKVKKHMEQSLANLSESSSAATGGGKDLRFTSDGIAHDLNRKPARVLASLKRLSAKGHVRKDSGGWLLVDQH